MSIRTKFPEERGGATKFEGVLSRNSGAVVIVLGTPSLNNKLREAERLGKLGKNFVRIEVTRALEQNLIVILLRFIKDIDQLLGTGHLQYIDGDTTRTEFEAVAAPEFTRRLRSALHEKLRRDFVDARQQIVAWIEKIREPVKQSDFWGQHWRELFEFKNEDGVSSEEVDVALVASGGSGKTVCLAHFLNDLIHNDAESKWHPFLAEPRLLRLGPSGVSELLKSSDLNELAERVHTTRSAFCLSLTAWTWWGSQQRKSSITSNPR